MTASEHERFSLNALYMKYMNVDVLFKKEG